MVKYETGEVYPEDFQLPCSALSLQLKDATGCTYPPGPEMNMQFSSPLQELLSSSGLDMTTHDVFTENGRERVCAVNFLYSLCYSTVFTLVQ